MSRRGFAVPAGQGRRLPAAGAHLLASGPDTGGQFTLIETRVPPGDRVPRHVHHRMDECFYVLSGSYSVQCGEDTFEASPGTFVFLPRGVPHAYQAGPDGGAKLILAVPGGFEDFFDDWESGLEMEELAHRHQVTFLAP